MIKRLKDHAYSNCFVEFNDNNIIFWSYRTRVITARPAIINGSWGYDITCSGTYSRTTARQISWFLHEYFPGLNYYDIKKIAGTCEAILYLERG